MPEFISELVLTEKIQDQMRKKEYRFLCVVLYSYLVEQSYFMRRSLPLLEKVWEDLVCFMCLLCQTPEDDCVLSSGFQQKFNVLAYPSLLIFKDGLCLNEVNIQGCYDCYELNAIDELAYINVTKFLELKIWYYLAQVGKIKKRFPPKT